MANAELVMLQTMKSNSRWLDSRFDAILKEHEGEYVAIKEQKIVSSDRDFDKLLHKLQKEGISGAETLIYFMTKSKMILGTV